MVDIGCGSGEFTATLAGLAHRGRVTGIDSDTSMLAAAQRHRAPNLSFVQAEATALAEVVEPATVDLVACRAMLHWLPAEQHWALYESVHAVLRPGGVFHLEAAAPGNVPHVVDLLADLAAQHDLPTPPAFPDPGVALELLEAAGFATDDASVRTVATRRQFTRDQLVGLLTSQVVLVLTRHTDPELARSITAEAVHSIERLRRHDNTFDQTFVRLEILTRRPE